VKELFWAQPHAAWDLLQVATRALLEPPTEALVKAFAGGGDEVRREGAG